METKELRAILIEKSALYKDALERANTAQKKIEDMLSTVDTDLLNRLKTTYNVNLDILKDMDLERLKTDSDYMDDVTRKLHTGIQQLREYVERSLNV